jgi:hypothetical protein
MPLKILMLAVIFGVPVIPTFWSILDIPKRRFATHKKKMLWFFVVATLPFIGGLIYILFVRQTTQPLENS